jgi:hypothetical protein
MEKKMKIDIDAVRAKIASEDAEKAQRVASLLEKADLLDEDGYPTDDALEIIEKWHWSDTKGWFEFIQSIWHLRSWGWTEGEEPHDWDENRKVYRYDISTAGWSGNEDIIRAMQRNDMLWLLTWVQSRRGGHYIFEGREDES